jgi:histidine ammonia-lyase
LQKNLILSHAVGVGRPAPHEIVRWMMLFKIHALTHGVSGVSRETIDCLRRMLNADLLPVVPTQGSLGASGDLAPLAHIVLAMIGKGTIHGDDDVRPAGEALAEAGIEPAVLGPKEGLGLINGTQFMCGYAAALVVHARRLLKHTDLIGCMSLEGLSGSLKPFDERLHQLRPHLGAIQTAENVRRMIVESEILTSHASCDRVQDPYSLRCMPQVHGASRDAVSHAAGIVETEINSVTDNPLLLGDDEIVSGGSFHGQPLALALDYLAIALAELASISERRIYLLLSGEAGLPVLLMKDTGLNSGFMVPQYTAAALVSENKGLCMPASVDSIPTSLGQEDHVSMGARAAVKCWQVLENTQTVLAIEQVCAAQALDFRAPLKAGLGPRVAREEVRKVIRHAEQDRLFGDDIKTSLNLLRSCRIVEAVEAAVGKLH